MDAEKCACSFKAVLQLRTTDRTWGLTAGSFMAHTDCSGVAKPTTAELLMLKTSHVAVAANKGIKAQELLHQWTANDHVMVKQHTAYRVKDRITREADSTYELDHQRIMPYLLELQRLNPGTAIDFKREPDPQNPAFLRYFYSLGAVTAIVTHSCISVTQLDAAHMKHRMYNGVVMVLEGADGDGKNVILAVGLAPKENEDNYNWFVGNCKISGLGSWLDQPGNVVITDRHKVTIVLNLAHPITIGHWPLIGPRGVALALAVALAVALALAFAFALLSSDPPCSRLLIGCRVCRRLLEPSCNTHGKYTALGT